MQKTQKRRLRWVGALALTVLIVAAIVYFPRGLRGPETVASEFLEALIRAPQDAAALRAAGHLADGDDPLALIEGLSTRIALDYLGARERHGIGHDVGIAERRRPAAQQYAAVLEVSEPGGDAPARRFAVTLQQRDDGDWRVSAVSVVEKPE